MARQYHKHLLFNFLLFFSLFIGDHSYVARAQNATSAQVHVGVVLDLLTMSGKMSRTSISMAIEDFYAENANFSTRVALDFRDSMSDVVAAASAAVDLLKNVKVQALIGPPNSSQAEFVAYLCNKAQIPVLSSATSPAISPSHLPFFIRAAANDSTRSAPIAAFIHLFGWRSVVPIYEDSDYGAGIIPSLVDSLQSADTRIPYRAVVPTSASDDQIDAILYRLTTEQTRVFIVDMLPELAARLFSRAHAIGMIKNGYVWIVTDSVGDVLPSLNSSMLNAMEGVIGFRPYVAPSDKVADFITRFIARFSRDYAGTAVVADPDVYQFWVYDAAQALAMAVESSKVTNPGFNITPTGITSSDLDRLGVSQTGPKLLAALLNTSFNGLTGKFRLVNGQLQLSAFEIVNVLGKGERSIGFWTPEAGITRDFNSTKRSGSNDNSLKSIIWPGDPGVAPKGWVIPTNEKKLRIAVPVKHGFNVFVNVSDPVSNASTVTGYCIDVFDAVMKKLPYFVPYEYVPFVDSSNSYDNLVYQVYLKKYEAVVGDTTIIANRTNYVDFTLPYTESGVSMIVAVKPDTSKTMWIFLKPLTAKLWLTSLAFFFFTGFVVWVIEHRINPEFRGTKSQQIGLIFYFAFSTLVFAHKEKLESNLSRLAVIIWVFVVLILTSSYTASLTSMLTVQQLQPTVTDVAQLLKNGDYVGYQDGSFVATLLERLGFDPSKMKHYSTAEQYVGALAKGSTNGGVSAIFDEILYLKVFLSQYCAEYTMVGPTYKTDGFGFVFPRDSPLVPDVSRAILNVTEGYGMTLIESKWFGDPTTCPSQSTSIGSSSLSFRSFAGLFIITGSVSGLMLLLYLITFIYNERVKLREASLNHTTPWEITGEWFRHYDGKDLNAPTFRKQSSEYSVSGRDGNQSEKAREEMVLAGLQSPVSMYNHSVESNQVSTREETPLSTEPSSPTSRGHLEESSVEIVETREER